jgi:hypothetical protein
MQTRQLLQEDTARPNLQLQVTTEYDANMNVVGIRFMYHPYSLSLSLSRLQLSILPMTSLNEDETLPYEDVCG